jgi:hypothetical protein
MRKVMFALAVLGMTMTTASAQQSPASPYFARVRTHRMAATATLAEAATRFAKRSAKRLGSGAVSQMFRPATENGPGSTPTRTWLARASINRARSNAA